MVSRLFLGAISIFWGHSVSIVSICPILSLLKILYAKIRSLYTINDPGCRGGGKEGERDEGDGRKGEGEGRNTSVN